MRTDKRGREILTVDCLQGPIEIAHVKGQNEIGLTRQVNEVTASATAPYSRTSLRNKEEAKAKKGGDETLQLN